MNIAKVRIQNFRCFHEISIPLTHIHALIGENGCGKTTVLEAIYLATSSSQPHLTEQDFNNADDRDLLIEVEFDEPFLMSIQDGYTTQDIPCQKVSMAAHRRERAAPGKAFSDPFVIERFAVPIEYGVNAVPIVSTGKATVNIPSSVKKTLKGYEATRKGGTQFPFMTTRLTLQNDTVNYPNIFYFDRDRESQATSGYNSLMQKIGKDLNWRYRKDWNQQDIESKWSEFYQAIISTVDGTTKERVIQPICDRLKRVASIDFANLELSILDIEQPFSRAFLSRREGTNQIEHKRFGSGISILLAYFLLEGVSKLSKDKIIFLIDEPELHLHPQLQKCLFKEFQTSDLQTIYTTQSDCYIDISTWNSITRFQTDYSIFPQVTALDEIRDGQEVRHHLDEIKKFHQHQLTFFKEDNQIFFSRKCLLVEGPAEKYGIPVLAAKLGKNIPDLTIISCNGKSKIPYYQLLCTAFGVPFFTLFDLDGKADTAPDNTRPHMWANQAARFEFATSFEGAFGISSDTDKKASKLLIKLDDIEPEKIPADIINAIEAIEKWSLI